MLHALFKILHNACHVHIIIQYMCLCSIMMYVYMCRFVRDNVLLAGLWFSKDKPPMNLFLSPVIQEINNLYREGMLFSTRDYQLHVCDFVGFLRLELHMSEYSTCDVCVPMRMHICVRACVCVCLFSITQQPKFVYQLLIVCG